MFDRILIANRGEIACRVIRTARSLGIATVAVYSDADADALHVALADEAVHIGPAAARESYLVGDKLIEAARRTGAQAVHPGYGFLSENAEFAEACAAAGLVFIGPPADAIRAMGGKAAAKALMEGANVPVVPGYHGDDQDEALLAAEAEAIGYPVLIKATAGGGGKGMRRVNAADAFARELASAKREAASAFGNDAVLIEKYIEQPRHIEIQVFADGRGNAVHLFERDCSLQRRHQKVVEEAPAPGMPEAVRAAMGKAAVDAARAVGYVGAGTVEFIADAAGGLRQDGFWFMEMNTRLQVEHPVTEMITGHDLVAWQLAVAAGEPLPVTQDDLAIGGHAFEVRLYAENPRKNFFPSTGRLERLRMPAGDGESVVRIDTGVREGDEVSIHYDPMIAKLIVHGPDRAAALTQLRRSLSQCAVAGIDSNLEFLGRVAAHPAFAAGEVETGFIDRHLDALVPPLAVERDAVVFAALAVAEEREAERRNRAATSADPHSPWGQLRGWRLGGQGHDDLTFALADEEIPVALHYGAASGTDGDFELSVGEERLPVRLIACADGMVEAVIDGRRRRADVAHYGDKVTVTLAGESWTLSHVDPLVVDDLDMGGEARITAPLPGKIVQLLVAPGDAVKKGAALLVLEAMKMEHTIAAGADATVESVNCAVGDQVEEGAELVAFAAEED